MAKWSVALWVKKQPRYYLKSKVDHRTVMTYVEEPTNFNKTLYYLYNVRGWEVRANPGDFIDYKPYKDREIWTPIERREFLILTINGLEREQMEALKEPYFNITDVKENLTQKHIDDLDPEEWITLSPNSYFNKRRMGMLLTDLSSLGVDLGRMFDLDDEYIPRIADLNKLQVQDKMRERKIDASDNILEYNPPQIKSGANLQDELDKLQASRIITPSISHLLGNE